MRSIIPEIFRHSSKSWLVVLTMSRLYSTTAAVCFPFRKKRGQESLPTEEETDDIGFALQLQNRAQASLPYYSAAEETQQKRWCMVVDENIRDDAFSAARDSHPSCCLVKSCFSNGQRSMSLSCHGSFWQQKLLISACLPSKALLS